MRFKFEFNFKYDFKLQFNFKENLEQLNYFFKSKTTFSNFVLMVCYATENDVMWY